MLSWRTSLAAMASLVCLAYAASSGTPDPAGPGTLEMISYRHGYEPQGFGIDIAGRAPHGLYPGTTKNLQLELSNPYGFDIKVLTLTGTVTRTSKRRCRPDNLIVQRYNGRLPLIVPGRRHLRAGSVPLRMTGNASAACQGATFFIHLTGTAAKVGR